jgi:hypothetical protein
MNKKEALSRQTNLVLPSLIDTPNVSFKQITYDRTHLTRVT